MEHHRTLITPPRIKRNGGSLSNSRICKRRGTLFILWLIVRNTLSVKLNKAPTEAFFWRTWYNIATARSKFKRLSMNISPSNVSIVEHAHQSNKILRFFISRKFCNCPLFTMRYWRKRLIKNLIVCRSGKKSKIWVSRSI